jgi:predicted Zn-dependent protease
MQTFSATYFTPEDREGKLAQVSLWPNELEIRLLQPSAGTIRWEAKRILPLADTTVPVYLKYKQGAHLSYLKFEEQAIVAEIKSLQAFSHIVRPSNRWMRILIGVVVFVLLLFSIAAASIYFLAPKLIEKIADTLPVETEVQMGDKLFEQTKVEFSFNEAQSKIAQQFFDSLRFDSRYPIRVHVVKSNELNAFAMPGGHIVVYDSIIRTMKSSNELAGLLAHECSHINKHHSTRTLIQMAGTYGLLSLLIGDVSGIASLIVLNANELLNMSYSRAFEQEADREGVKLLVKRGVDPQGMVQLLKQLKAAETNVVPQFLSTHPLTDARIADVKREIKQLRYSPQNTSQLDSLFSVLK